MNSLSMQDPDPMGNGLPASVQTEVTVLGAMLLDAIAISDATATLRPEDFSLDSHQRVFKVILDLLNLGRAVDYITVMDSLTRTHELDAIGGPAYLAYLTEGIPRNPKIEDYVHIIKDKSMLRQALSVCQDGMTLAIDPGAHENALDVINGIDQRLMDIAEGGLKGDLTGIGEIVTNSFGSIDGLYEQGREITGMATHYIEFDKMTSGLQNGELTIIAARPSMGKTAWAINIAQNVSVRESKKVAIFSMEMSKESLLRRMLASEAAISSRKIERGFIAREDKGKLISALDRLICAGLFIDDSPNLTIAEMRAKARRMRHRQGGLDLILVDYLQLMQTPTDGRKRYGNRTEEVSSISRGLKGLAKELGVPVIALSQLSRNSEQRGSDKRPMLSDLRESGSIEQDADVVAFIHREEYYDRDNEDIKGKAEIIIAKQRNGPTGKIDLAWISEFTRFENLDMLHGGY